MLGLTSVSLARPGTASYLCLHCRQQMSWFPSVGTRHHCCAWPLPLHTPVPRCGNTRLLSNSLLLLSLWVNCLCKLGAASSLSPRPGGVPLEAKGRLARPFSVPAWIPQMGDKRPNP